ncbi:MAG: hypothetical protein FWC60_09610 [Firmicutes bacterium]|nr:hypothetical protein [Bacillota bacterium]
MNYMWEVLLEAEELGLTKEDIRFIPSPTANPYREIFFRDFNKPIIGQEPINVNAYYRYDLVFGPLLHEEMDEWPELQAVLFDIIAHYLSEADLRSGLCRAQYYACFLVDDIIAGLYGRQNAARLLSFNKKERHLVSAGLLRLYKVGSSIRLFAQLMRELYPDSIVYLDARGIRELLVYIGLKQTPARLSQLELLCDMFVPADYDVKLFWDLHFGLIGTDETMEIGSIMLF